MIYCRRCVLPDTRPGLRIGADGVCSACVAQTEKSREVDWADRRRAFEALVRTNRRRGRGYDCLVPVSGGKDSTWQIVTCLEYGLHPLAVTWKPPARSAIGARNLANLVRLGVDHIDYQINPRVEKKFLYQALLRYGATAIPMHMALFGIPLTLAVTLGIPLVIWGENSADEYTGSGDASRGHRLDSAWLRTHGVTHGTTAEDWISEELTEQELTPYFRPSDEELSRHHVRAVFLGYYFPWDPLTSFEVARAHGFQARAEGPNIGYYPYADIDDDFISIHHYVKWYKFGFTRLFDNLALEIRNGRMRRDEAIEIIRMRGDETPHEDIDAFCRFVEISPAQFFTIIERFRNVEIWSKRDGTWMIDQFLVPDWRWNERGADRAAARV